MCNRLVLVDFGHPWVIRTHNNVELLIPTIIAIASIVLVKAECAQEDASHGIQSTAHHLRDLIPSLLPQGRDGASSYRSAHVGKPKSFIKLATAK